MIEITPEEICQVMMQDFPKEYSLAVQKVYIAKLEDQNRQLAAALEEAVGNGSEAKGE